MTLAEAKAKAKRAAHDAEVARRAAFDLAKATAKARALRARGHPVEAFIVSTPIPFLVLGALALVVGGVVLFGVLKGR